MSGSVTCAMDPAGIAVVRLDDGRANALDRTVMADLDAAFRSLPEQASAVVLTGRPGFFCAGLDRSVTRPESGDEVAATLAGFASLLSVVLGHPRPVVASVTGHALAAGMLLAMCADRVIAASGDYRWGLVETRVGVPQSHFGLTLARYRMGRAADSWALLGETRTPADALAVGVVDRLTLSSDVLSAAREEALALSAIPVAAFRTTKARLRSGICSVLLHSDAEGAPNA